MGQPHRLCAHLNLYTDFVHKHIELRAIMYKTSYKVLQKRIIVILLCLCPCHYCPALVTVTVVIRHQSTSSRLSLSHSLPVTLTHKHFRFINKPCYLQSCQPAWAIQHLFSSEESHVIKRKLTSASVTGHYIVACGQALAVLWIRGSCHQFHVACQGPQVNIQGALSPHVARVFGEHGRFWKKQKSKSLNTASTLGGVFVCTLKAWHLDFTGVLTLCGACVMLAVLT